MSVSIPRPPGLPRNYEQQWNIPNSITREESSEDILSNLSYILLDNQNSRSRKESLIASLRKSDSEYIELQERLSTDLAKAKLTSQQLSNEISIVSDRIQSKDEDIRSTEQEISSIQSRSVNIHDELHQIVSTGQEKIHELEGKLLNTRDQIQTMANNLSKVDLEIQKKESEVSNSMKKLQSANYEIDRLRACKEKWLHDLERSVMRPVIGIEVRETKNDENSGLCLYVVALAPGGAGAKSGLKVGDSLTHFDGTEIKNKSDFARFVLNSNINSIVTLQVNRQEKSPNGKLISSIEHIPVQIYGAVPSGLDIDTLRNSPDPVALIQKFKQGQRAGSSPTSSSVGR